MADSEFSNKPYASPVCYAHELDPLYRDLDSTETGSWQDVQRWRISERERLLNLRKQLTAEQRQIASKEIAAALNELLEHSDDQIIGAYWPIHQEPDLRDWMTQQSEQGRVIALPVINKKQQPLQYVRWHPGCAMRKGIWGIAEPAQQMLVKPDLVIAPVLGVDRARYRLGNGGGYFDRTLAANKPLSAVGVGFSCAAINTIYPQAHDIPMDRVILATG